MGDSRRRPLAAGAAGVALAGAGALLLRAVLQPKPVRHKAVVPPSSGATLTDLTIDATDPRLVQRAVEAWREHGCFVVRGLNCDYVGEIAAEVRRVAAQSLALEQAGRQQPIEEGWVTPDGTLFIPAAWDGTRFEKFRSSVAITDVANANEDATPPASHAAEESLPAAALRTDGSVRDKQMMVLGLDYHTCASLLRCACDEKTVNICAAIFAAENAAEGADAVELFGDGQLVYKEPCGGHLVNFHQDSAFFEFAGVGPVGTLNYAIDTDLTRNNGPLYVLPGSHRVGFIPHVDTSSHLGLEPRLFNTDTEGMVAVEGRAGDAIFFHQYCVHGSPPNHSSEPRPTFINRYTRPTDAVTMPLATSVTMREDALARARHEPPTRARGFMVHGSRRVSMGAWGDEKGHQFH